MKEKFSEYYSLSADEIKKHWEKDVFSFDANVLLNLYRYTPSTREAFFNLLEKLKGRIWISYQAAYEYQKNRLYVINAQKEAYKEIRDILEKKKNEIETKLNSFKKHPYLLTNDLKKQIGSAFSSISRDLEKYDNSHPDYINSDPILERLTNLLEKCIGDDFNQDDLDKIFRESKKRYEEKVPPGYMDLKDKKDHGNRSLYGDVIVWKQIIKEAENRPDSIIFVTDDLKEDWWYKFKGKTIGPRPELLKEFREKTNKRINIYQADLFLEYANINLQQNTTQEAIDEVRKVRLEDEKDLHAINIKDSIEVNTDERETRKSSFETRFDEFISENKEKDIQ